jgi:transposase
MTESETDQPRYRDKEWLYEEYWGNEKSTREIAKICDCHNSTISTWLARHDIETRSEKETPDLRLKNAEWLQKQYHEKERTMGEIRAECGCSRVTVQRWLKRHEIETFSRHRSSDAAYRDADWLREKYWGEKKSSHEIAAGRDFSPTTVQKWLNKHGIETRDRSPVPDKRLKNAKWLRDRYWACGRSTPEIAEECGCAASTVGEWLKKHGIDMRSPTPEREGANHPNWKGGRTVYGEGWSAEKRKKVRERDGFVCVRCGMSQSEHESEHNQNLHVHHLTKARNIDDPKERNAVENLVTLCHGCHNRYEKLADAGLRPEMAAD